MTKEQEDIIRKFASKYSINLSGVIPPQDEKKGIPLDNLYIRRFNVFFMPSITDVLKEEGISSSQMYHLLKLIELLAKSLKNEHPEITITTKIKARTHSATIDNKEMISHLWRFANIILDYMQDGIYEYEPKYDDIQEEVHAL